MVTQQVNNILRHLKQMTMGEMKEHVSKNADQQGNLWCHLEGCRGTCTPYQVNIWGLRKTAANREEGHRMVPQQVQEHPASSERSFLSAETACSNKCQWGRKLVVPPGRMQRHLHSLSGEYMGP